MMLSLPQTARRRAVTWK